MRCSCRNAGLGAFCVFAPYAARLSVSFYMIIMLYHTDDYKKIRTRRRKNRDRKHHKNLFLIIPKSSMLCIRSCIIRFAIQIGDKRFYTFINIFGFTIFIFHYNVRSCDYTDFREKHT